MDLKTGIKKIFTLRILLGIVVGGLLGFSYYYFIGCNSGGCAITSDPLRMTGFGMLSGALLISK